MVDKKKGYVLSGVLVVIAALGIYLYQLFQLPKRLPAVPEALTIRAEIPGIPNARFWIGIEIEPMVREVIAARERERAFLARSGHTGEFPPAALLALSGGGDKGAFGAGLMTGWTETGTRPTFKAVTGVSTGALIAPFAYLGPKYDNVLTEVYTHVKPEDIAQKRSIIAAIQDDGMADNRPLWTLISKHVDQTLLAAIAAEHANGRLLLIGTTNLDARQPVIWNMGAIAASGTPAALELFRSILLASAAIPGAFPPTMVRVTVDGQFHDEMHVDGGASTQVFLYPPFMRNAAGTMGDKMTREATVYVIRNSALAAPWNPAERQTIDIAARAIGALIHTQGMGDLYRIYLTAQRDGLDFNLAYIGADFSYQGKSKQFETAYMQALYGYGERLAKGGYSWHKLPPGLDTPYGR
jgi:predicted acylesterase/phospholipase RssA